MLVVTSLAGVGVAVTTRPASAMAQEDAIVAFAASQHGDPYCFGGGGIHGPSGATINPPNPGCGPHSRATTA